MSRFVKVTSVEQGLEALERIAPNQFDTVEVKMLLPGGAYNQHEFPKQLARKMIEDGEASEIAYAGTYTEKIKWG
jgi:hypothetical protein